MKNILGKLTSKLPHPIKSFQNYFEIEEEIFQIKTYFKPYKFSLFLFFGLLSYPLLKPIFQKYLEPTKKTLLTKYSYLNKAQIEATSKQIVQSILNDQTIRKEGALYVEKLAKESVVKSSVVKLLEISVKDPEFIKASKELAKDISNDLLKDKEIEGKMAAITIKTLTNPEIKQETSNVIKWAFVQEETKEKLVELLKSGFEDERMRAALTGALSNSFYEIMNQQETIEKLKMFSYFLMENDPEESENVRNMIDSIVERVLNKKMEDNRRSELDKILNIDETPKEKERTHRKEKVL